MSKVTEKEIPRRVHMTLRVNGEDAEVSFAPYKTLLEVLREDLGLTGTKHGCELGECGACAVLIDGAPLLSCLTLALECEGRAIETIEGVAQGNELHPLQEAFADLGGSQCGYCTPGAIMTAKALLDHEPSPSPQRIREAMAGNLCR
ncbi:MAG: (2Fe-2S)-binding protein, partial [Proteobacteria bacterium]|nr:(2Fe-2S)-binding protein [Pseudomonadota bacterium]